MENFCFIPLVAYAANHKKVSQKLYSDSVKKQFSKALPTRRPLLYFAMRKNTPLKNITTLSTEKRVRNCSEFTRKCVAKKTGP